MKGFSLGRSNGKVLLLAIIAIAVSAATAIFAYGVGGSGNPVVSFSEPSSEKVTIEAAKAKM